MAFVLNNQKQRERNGIKTTAPIMLCENLWFAVTWPQLSSRPGRFELHLDVSKSLCCFLQFIQFDQLSLLCTR